MVGARTRIQTARHLLLTTNKHTKYHTRLTANNKQTTYCFLNRKQYKTELVGRSESLHFVVKVDKTQQKQTTSRALGKLIKINDKKTVMTTSHTVVIVTTKLDNINTFCKHPHRCRN